MAHGHIAVVAAQHHLGALGDDPPVPVDAGVHRGLAAAGADGLDLGDGVRQLHEPPGAGEEVGQKVGAQAEAEHRQVILVHQGAQLVDLLGGKELGLVGDDHVMLPGGPVGLENVLVRGDDPGPVFQADAAADQVRPVPGVHAGLDEPDGHALFLVIELGDQRLGGFGGAHGPVFEIKLRHNKIPSCLLKTQAG